MPTNSYQFYSSRITEPLPPSPAFRAEPPDPSEVKERQPPNHETQPRSCPISHIRERAEADHQAWLDAVSGEMEMK